jgi:hypothetical protein
MSLGRGDPFSDLPCAVFVEVAHDGQLAPVVIEIRQGVVLASGA